MSVYTLAQVVASFMYYNYSMATITKKTTFMWVFVVEYNYFYKWQPCFFLKHLGTSSGWDVTLHFGYSPGMEGTTQLE